MRFERFEPFEELSVESFERFVPFDVTFFDEAPVDAEPADPSMITRAPRYNASFTMPLAARTESADTPYCLAMLATESLLRTMWARNPAAAPDDTPAFVVAALLCLAFLFLVLFDPSFFLALGADSLLLLFDERVELPFDDVAVLVDDDVGPFAVTPTRTPGVTVPWAAPAVGAISTVGMSSDPAAMTVTGTVRRRCCTRMSPESAPGTGC